MNVNVIYRSFRTSVKQFNYNFNVLKVQTRNQSTLHKSAGVNKVIFNNKYFVSGSISPIVRQLQTNSILNTSSSRLSSLQIKKRKRKTLDDETRELKPGVR
jgi:hypothetical protein